MAEWRLGGRAALRSWLREGLRAGRFGPLSRLERLDRDQWQALAAYRGLVHQAFTARPLAPQVSSDLWDQGDFRSSKGCKPFFNPARRELEPSSHHYGHDVLLKRHAGRPLIGAPLPFLLEHGLKVSREATFERPLPWAKGYLCMGPLRAAWLRERFGLPAVPIGPWISYARPVLGATELAALRDLLGRTLLVVLAHSWDRVERRVDLPACVAAVQRQAEAGGYCSVIWLRHWKDPELMEMPPEWIVACNGHRSNPWFLDAMRTLLELSDGLVSNAFGTHLGYGAALGKRLHWIDNRAEQNLSGLSDEKAREETIEWQERQRLSSALSEALAAASRSGTAEGQAEVRVLLDPYWGFEHTRAPAELRAILVGRSKALAACPGD